MTFLLYLHLLLPTEILQPLSNLLKPEWISFALPHFLFQFNPMYLILTFVYMLCLREILDLKREKEERGRKRREIFGEQILDL